MNYDLKLVPLKDMDDVSIEVAFFIVSVTDESSGLQRGWYLLDDKSTTGVPVITIGIGVQIETVVWKMRSVLNTEISDKAMLYMLPVERVVNGGRAVYDDDFAEARKVLLGSFAMTDWTYFPEHSPTDLAEDTEIKNKGYLWVKALKRKLERDAKHELQHTAVLN